MVSGDSPIFDTTIDLGCVGVPTSASAKLIASGVTFVAGDNFDEPHAVIGKRTIGRAIQNVALKTTAS
jgi:hypothetical protein